MRSQPGLPHWLSLHPSQLFRKPEEGIRLFTAAFLSCKVQSDADCNSVGLGRAGNLHF